MDFLDWFHEETGIDQKDREGYRKDAEALIASGTMYFWRDEKGKDVASCSYGPTDDMASINLVYTHPDYRRKHYAENMVFRVTEIAKEAGLTPMLYMDADYVASNACYEKIGYVLKGRLCAVKELEK